MKKIILSAVTITFYVLSFAQNKGMTSTDWANIRRLIGDSIKAYQLRTPPTTITGITAAEVSKLISDSLINFTPVVTPVVTTATDLTETKKLISDSLRLYKLKASSVGLGELFPPNLTTVKKTISDSLRIFTIRNKTISGDVNSIINLKATSFAPGETVEISTAPMSDAAPTKIKLNGIGKIRVDKSGFNEWTIRTTDMPPIATPRVNKPVPKQVPKKKK